VQTCDGTLKIFDDERTAGDTRRPQADGQVPGRRPPGRLDRVLVVVEKLPADSSQLLQGVDTNGRLQGKFTGRGAVVSASGLRNIQEPVAGSHEVVVGPRRHEQADPRHRLVVGHMRRKLRHGQHGALELSVDGDAHGTPERRTARIC
jgi:hypothetical protein